MESGRGEKDKQDTGEQGCGKGGGREDNSARRQLGQRFCRRSVGGMGEGVQPQRAQRGREGEREGGGRRDTRKSREPLRGFGRGLFQVWSLFPHAILCSVVDSPWHHMAMAVRVENRLCQHDCP